MPSMLEVTGATEKKREQAEQDREPVTVRRSSSGTLKSSGGSKVLDGLKVSEVGNS